MATKQKKKGAAASTSKAKSPAKGKGGGTKKTPGKGGITTPRRGRRSSGDDSSPTSPDAGGGVLGSIGATTPATTPNEKDADESPSCATKKLPVSERRTSPRRQTIVVRKHLRLDTVAVHGESREQVDSRRNKKVSTSAAGGPVTTSVLVTSEEEKKELLEQDESERQALIKSKFKTKMVRWGAGTDVKQKRSEVSSYVRNSLWRGVKFASPGHMHFGGPIFKAIKHSLFLKKHSDVFSNEWDTWVMKHVRSTINKKRSAVSQSVGKMVIGTY
jgi:hypothetical protein